MRANRFLCLATVAVVGACSENSMFSPDAGDGVDGPPLPACSDDIDNDEDGLVDFPYDPGCSAPQEDREVDNCPDGPGCPQCSDGVDNDGNGTTDFPDDASGCMAASDPVEFTDDPNACGQGMMIKQLPTTGMDSGMLTGTTSSVASPCGGGNGLPAVAYVFHLTTPRVIVATTEDSGTTIDTVLDLRSSMCAMQGAELTCHDDIAPGTGTAANKKSALAYALQPGTYYLIVGGKTATDTGAYTLRVDFRAGEGAVCGATEDCGPGLVCRIPLNEAQMMCAKPVCSDGVDDDADGKTDYPYDPGCASSADDDEDDVCAIDPLDPQCPACSNSVDDNSNGDTDYPAEANCLSAASTSESCVQSEPVGVITQAVTMGTTAGAANDYKPTCGSTTHSAPDVVYRLDLPIAMATLDLEVTGFDSAHALLSSSCENPAIACSDPALMKRTNVPAGTYYVVIDGWSTGNGNFTLTTSGTIAGGQSCEGPLVQAGAFTCAAGFTCGGTPGSRTCVPLACTDGVDNDGDGKTDIADPGCTSAADNDEADDDCSPTVGPNCPECSDGIDNDADGNIDYPTDTSCVRASSNSEACTETEPILTITQGITMGTTAGATNDFKPTCSSSTHTAPDVTYRLEVPQMATLDLNVSGFDSAHVLLNSTCGGTAIACSDPALMKRTNVAAGTYYVVIDGWSSGNGPFTLTTSGTVAPGGSCEGMLFQSGAFTCAAGYTCGGTVGSRTCVVAQCNDATDNDGDGKVDVADPGCTSAADNDETDDCWPTVGPNCPECSDGMDNDGDGTTDYPADTGCLRASGDNEMCPHSESTVTLTMPQTVGTTATAVDDVKLTCASSTSTAPDTAHRLDVPAMQTLTIQAATSFDSAIALFGATCGGTAVHCEESQITNPEVLTVNNLAGGTYYFVVDGWGSGSGTYTLNVSGTIQSGASCESALAQSGAIVCPPQHTCAGPVGDRRCLGAFACNDGMDNDSDGKIDYPEEPGCTSPSDTDESDPCPGPDCPQCGNGIDDDLDMLTDFPADTRCPNASFFSEGLCTKEVAADLAGVITMPTTMDTLAGRGANYEQSCQSNSGNDVVYGLHLPVPVTTLEINTLGSPQDTVLSLWDAACSTEIECDDDGAGMLKSRIKRNNMAAGEYAIQIDCYDAAVNNTTFQLNVKGTVAAGTACTDPLFTSGVLECAQGTTCTGGTCQ